jgi:hypothetical protein
MQPLGQLDQSCAEVIVERAGEEAVGSDAQDRQQAAEDERRNQHQARAERQCHGAVSLSM